MAELREEDFLREHFRRFYASNEIKSVPSVEMREFGIGAFGKKIARRHISFSTNKDLNFFLRTEVPLFISCSAAYYKDPAARPMESKGLIGSDLVYEFDASDVDSDCKQKHDFWMCEKCGKTYKFVADNCDNCGGKLSQFKFPCEKCIGETKKQTFRLINILVDELGFSNIYLNFSGNAGYHVHVRDAGIKGLSQDARLAIVDYLTGEGFSFEKSGFDFENLLCPKINEAKGLRKRILDRMIFFVCESSSDWLFQFGSISLSTSQKRSAKVFVRNIVENRQKAVLQIQSGVLPLFGSKSIAASFWKAIAENSLRLESFPIDRQTSADIYKIVRVPDTLHGSTGFIAKTISVDLLNDFDPFEHALAFGNGQIKVFISKAPEFKIQGAKFGPFEKEEVQLPENAAIYLLAKGVGKLA
ncbi:MAG: hypothetical protein N3F05_02560 [Candidatus Diapherotrites archaeon]|nr:hypothetical protein [Candidatus Diapherotrites archaeon]